MTIYTCCMSTLHNLARRLVYRRCQTVLGSPQTIWQAHDQAISEDAGTFRSKMHRRFHLRLANIYDPSTIFFVNVSLPLSGPDCTACIGLVAPTFHGSPCFSGTTSTCPRSHVKVSEDAPPRPPEPMPSWRKHHNRRLSGAGKGTSFIANEPSVGDTISIVDLQEKGGLQMHRQLPTFIQTHTPQVRYSTE